MKPVRWKLILVITAVVAIGMIWNERDRQEQTLEPAPVATSGELVKIEDFRAEWPFTVNRGYADCINGLPVFRTGDRVYGLTGAAQQRGYPPPNEIWRVNPDILEARIPFTNIRDIALQQCN